MINIEELMEDSEYDVLEMMSDFYSSKGFMESYYEEGATTTVEATPTVDNVSAFTRFVNWLGRIITAIRTKIRKHFSDKQIKKLREYITKNQADNDVGMVPYTFVKVIDDGKWLIDHKMDGITMMSEFNEKENWQRINQLWDNCLKKYKVEENALINIDTQTKSFSTNMKKFNTQLLDKTVAIINRLSDMAEHSNEIVKKEKARVTDDIVKSNNFKQWVSAISKCATYSFKMIKTVTDAIRSVIMNIEKGSRTLKIVDVHGTLTMSHFESICKGNIKNASKLIWIYMRPEQWLDPDYYTKQTPKVIADYLSNAQYTVPGGYRGRGSAEKKSLHSWLKTIDVLGGGSKMMLMGLYTTLGDDVNTFQAAIDISIKEVGLVILMDDLDRNILKEYFIKRIHNGIYASVLKAGSHYLDNLSKYTNDTCKKMAKEASTYIKNVEAKANSTVKSAKKYANELFDKMADVLERELKSAKAINEDIYDSIKSRKQEKTEKNTHTKSNDSSSGDWDKEYYDKTNDNLEKAGKRGRDILKSGRKKLNEILPGKKDVRDASKRARKYADEKIESGRKTVTDNLGQQSKRMRDKADELY